MTILLAVQTAASAALGEITTDTFVLLATEPRTVPLLLVTAQLSGVPVQTAAPPLIWYTPLSGVTQ
jgi:hypothetical protein